MMASTSRTPSWTIVAVLVAAAAGLGYGASHWIAAKKPPLVSTAPAVPAAEADSAAEIKIPADYLAAAGIAVEPVRNGGFDAEILAPAIVAAAPNSEAVIVARAAGTIARVHRQLGDSVRAGDVLATVDSPDAASMTAERNTAAARLELARKMFAREAALFNQGVTPRQDMEAAQSALAVAEAEAQRAAAIARAANLAADGKSIAVISPIAGKVTVSAATLGAYVQPQLELFRVAGAGETQIEAAVSAADIARIAPGNQATVIAANGTLVKATVRAVTPSVSGSTRAATVVLTPAATGKLVVGEGVQVRLHVDAASKGLVVPEDAVQNIDGHDVVFLRTKEGFRAQPVLVGARSHGLAHIVSGVTAGQPVATKNAFLVKADTIKSAKDE